MVDYIWKMREHQIGWFGSVMTRVRNILGLPEMGLGRAQIDLGAHCDVLLLS